jgi:23S rRNA (adenine2503-C2)-methyltransferase
VKELLGLTSHELSEYVNGLGEKAFHGRQIYRAIYVRRQFNVEALSELSRPLRKRLSFTATITPPHLHSVQRSHDGTRKYLLELADQRRIEAVLIPEAKRDTFCISTQAGCGMDCQFCLTALMGYGRNLTAGEIVGQVLYLSNDRVNDSPDVSTPTKKPINVVLMGMGEPLHNFENVVKALVLMTDPEGIALPRSRITLSTVGLAPKIIELAKAPVVPNLAISLSATSDDVRDRLMPINRKYPIRTLLDACTQFPLPPRSYVTFEYVLIDGVNDTDADARRLVRLLAGLKAKVNLLPLNPGNPHNLRPSPSARVNRFQQILIEKDLPSYVRRPRGADISAACGQLSLANKKPEGEPECPL